LPALACHCRQNNRHQLLAATTQVGGATNSCRRQRAAAIFPDGDITRRAGRAVRSQQPAVTQSLPAASSQQPASSQRRAPVFVDYSQGGQDFPGGMDMAHGGIWRAPRPGPRCPMPHAPSAAQLAAGCWQMLAAAAAACCVLRAATSWQWQCVAVGEIGPI
jgi:hypothetical protein